MTFAQRVNAEVARARNKHAPVQTIHEGYAVLLEEVDEFWHEVKNSRPYNDALLSELVQVAAMAQRIAEDTGLIDDGES